MELEGQGICWGAMHVKDKGKRNGNVGKQLKYNLDVTSVKGKEEEGKEGWVEKASDFSKTKIQNTDNIKC